jgi:hypothetical protein
MVHFEIHRGNRLWYSFNLKSRNNGTDSTQMEADGSQAQILVFERHNLVGEYLDGGGDRVRHLGLDGEIIPALGHRRRGNARRRDLTSLTTTH